MSDTKENSLLLKATAGLLGVVGTLLTVISCLIMNKIDNLQATVEKLGPAVVTNTANISALQSNVSSLQTDMKGCLQACAQFNTLVALKPDEIRIRRERNGQNN
jgi:hypothetical protein